MHLSELDADRARNSFLFLGTLFCSLVCRWDQQYVRTSPLMQWESAGKEILLYMYLQSHMSFCHTSQWPTPDDFWKVPDVVGETSLMSLGKCYRTAWSRLNPGCRLAPSAAGTWKGRKVCRTRKPLDDGSSTSYPWPAAMRTVPCKHPVTTAEAVTECPEACSSC